MTSYALFTALGHAAFDQYKGSPSFAARVRDTILGCHEPWRPYVRQLVLDPVEAAKLVDEVGTALCAEDAARARGEGGRKDRVVVSRVLRGRFGL